MGYADSVSKIVHTYFRAVTAEPFTYEGKTYQPKALRASPDLFRGFTCPAGCGGCCHKFSLDYLPSEEEEIIRFGLVPRAVQFNGRRVGVFSDVQLDNPGGRCRHLNPSDGRCGIHGAQPFTCDFELIRFSLFDDDSRPNMVTTRLFGRGWNMLRVDGERGALCGITPPTAERAGDVARLLRRLQTWTDHFGLSTCLPDMIEWAESGPHVEPGFFNNAR